MSLTFLIATVDKTASVAVSTLAVTDTLGSRNTCSFTLDDPTGTYLPVIGASIVITNGATRIFAGTIDDFTASDLSPETVAGLQFAIDCVDYNQLADRFEVAKAYSTAGQTLHDIVADLVSTSSTVPGATLAAEGVTMGGVATGPPVVSAVWNYLSVATAFNDLADLAGYSWWIDYNKVLWFQPRAGITAPFSLSDTSGNFRKLTVKRSRTDYRNTQIVRAGTDLASVRTDSWKGDGSTRAFPVVYNVGAAPTAMKVNGTAKTIGVLNVDTGKDWYYQIGSPLITQDSSGTLLSATDVGAVTYQGQFPIVVVATSDGEVAARAAAEGGTGVYQETEYYPNVNGTPQASGSATAQQIANSLLQKFGVIPVIVDFETDSDGLFSGQLIHITNTKYGLSNPAGYLISRVSFGDFTGTGKLRYQVEVYDGQFLGDWERFFREIASRGQTYIIRQNEVVTYLRTASYLTGVGVKASESLTQNARATAVNAAAAESLAAPTLLPIESRVGFAMTDLSETG